MNKNERNTVSYKLTEKPTRAETRKRLTQIKGREPELLNRILSLHAEALGPSDGVRDAEEIRDAFGTVGCLIELFIRDNRVLRQSLRPQTARHAIVALLLIDHGFKIPLEHSYFHPEIER